MSDASFSADVLYTTHSFSHSNKNRTVMGAGLFSWFGGRFWESLKRIQEILKPGCLNLTLVRKEKKKIE